MITLTVQGDRHDQQMPGAYADAQFTAFAPLPVNGYMQVGFHRELRVLIDATIGKSIKVLHEIAGVSRKFTNDENIRELPALLRCDRKYAILNASSGKMIENTEVP